MSPLVAAPNRGYADWQRVSNWDTGILYSDPGTATAGSITTPILDVSREAYLAGLDQCTAGRCTLTITWFADAAGAVRVGGRTFVVSSNIVVAAQYRLPNLGPFVQLQWSAILGAAFTHTAKIFATNRYHPLEVVPDQTLLLHVENQALGAGFSTTVWPSEYYAGPVQVWINTPIAGWSMSAFYGAINPSFPKLYVPTIGVGDSTFSFIVPIGEYGFQVTNGSAGNGNFTLTIAHSVTGAT